MNIKEEAKKMKLISPEMAASSIDARNLALKNAALILKEHAGEIFEENKKDIAQAEKAGIADSIIKRLKFNAEKLNGVIEGINQLVLLPDPLGNITLNRDLDEGLNLRRISCPIGVIGVIFEARPDALVQISTLCIKSGNCAILKGGRETANTNRILFRLVKEAAIRAKLPEMCLLQAEAHNEIDELLKCHEYVDLLIPRGSNAFVKYIMDNTKIPVMGHADGVCHIYVDNLCRYCGKKSKQNPEKIRASVLNCSPVETGISEKASEGSHSGTYEGCPFNMANKIIIDAKTQYTAACNAAETLLVNRSVAPAFLPELFKALKENNVKVLGTQEVSDVIHKKTASGMLQTPGENAASGMLQAAGENAASGMLQAQEENAAAADKTKTPAQAGSGTTAAEKTDAAQNMIEKDMPWDNGSEGGIPEFEIIEDEDFGHEYLDLVLAVKLVDSVDEAIEHINKYGSHHTDSIISNNEENISRFMALTDSAGVYANCSTRFADGFRYGFGAEVGISTGKIHARGPVGLEGLVTYKYCLKGHGHIVADYASGKEQFHFKDRN